MAQLRAVPYRLGAVRLRKVPAPTSTALSPVGCSALFLWLAFRNTDFRSIGTSLKAAEPLYALPFLAFLFVFYWLKSMRWSDLLSPNAVIGAGQLFNIWKSFQKFAVIA